jgi:hypothetical protein
MNRIEEVFTPPSVQTLDDLLSFLVEEITRRGGDPLTVRMVNTEEAIPNVKFSDEWPCWTLTFDHPLASIMEEGK